MDDVRGVLLDIDGVLTVSWAPVPGAASTIPMPAACCCGAALVAFHRNPY